MSDGLAALSALVKKMTPGRWETDGKEVDQVSPDDGSFICSLIERQRGYDDYPTYLEEADLRGLVALRNVAEELIAVAEAVEVHRLRGRMDVSPEGADVFRKANALRAKLEGETP